MKVNLSGLKDTKPLKVYSSILIFIVSIDGDGSHEYVYEIWALYVTSLPR